MKTPRILIQFDTDQQPSVFDSVVAIDAGVEHLFRHGSVTPDNVVPLVHGAVFTRGAAALTDTAIFLGGSNVAAVEQVAERVARTFFGPCRVSVLIDPNGANSTATAAVLAAARHLPLTDVMAAKSIRAVVLGGTGPVGERVSRLLAGLGVETAVVSRSIERAAEVCDRIMLTQPIGLVSPVAGPAVADAVVAADLVIAAGAAGVTLLDADGRRTAARCRVFIDLNAVPPAGIVGIDAGDKARADGEAVVYGALGVGGLKMKIHRAAVASLFEATDRWLDAEQLLELGRALETGRHQG